jgi:hypothetical protein
LIPTSANSKTFSLGPKSYEPPQDLVKAETKRLPFVHTNPNLDLWTNQLGAWPFPMDGWVNWYQRVEEAHGATWQITRIADALSLSLAPMEKDDNLLRSIGYFWSDSLNCFLLGSGPMTPTLMDVAMILGLDVQSSCPSPYSLSECSFTKIVDKSSTRNWGQYISLHNKQTGSVSPREHVAFLNLWLDHFLFKWSFPGSHQKLPEPGQYFSPRPNSSLGKTFPRHTVSTPVSEYAAYSIWPTYHNRWPLVVRPALVQVVFSFYNPRLSFTRIPILSKRIWKINPMHLLWSSLVSDPCSSHRRCRNCSVVQMLLQH